MPDIRNAATVMVTREDVANGVQGSPTKCPVALAIRRALDLSNAGFFIAVHVDSEGVEIQDMDGGDSSIYLMHDAGDFIEDFDEDPRNATVRDFTWLPIRFIVTLTDPA